MEDTINRISALIAKHLQGDLTENEAHELYAWRDSSIGNQELFERLTDQETVHARMGEYYEAGETILERIRLQMPEIRVVPIYSKRKWQYMAVAAAILIICILGTYQWRQHPVRPSIANIPVRFKNDVLPGGNKAILTLGDGSVITLDSAHRGMISRQGGVSVVKTSEGQLAYTGVGKPTEMLFNSISTPRGGQYKVILPDGSKVWLNAESKLRYPTVFSGKERDVELTGEAYFEVAKDPSKEFIVNVSMGSQSQEAMRVQVLGTHFNVMAYSDENSINTTLLEGSVKVTEGMAAGILQPGEQMQASKEGELKKLTSVNTEEVVAWKDGLFKCKKADIGAVMRQIARWYDVQVVYTGPINQLFYVSIPRNVPVSEVLDLLELTKGVHFGIDGRKIIVMP